MAHAWDLRSEVKDDALAAQVQKDYRQANLDPPTRAVMDFVVKLTRTPGRMQQADVQVLREHGHSDAAIHDIVQVAAYFNYINRVADGLCVDLEPEMPPKGSCQ